MSKCKKVMLTHTEIVTIMRQLDPAVLGKSKSAKSAHDKLKVAANTRLAR